MLARRTLKLSGVNARYSRYAAYSRSTYCWFLSDDWQWVTSFNRLCFRNIEVFAGFSVNLTLRGGKEQVCFKRRTMPRVDNSIGSTSGTLPVTFSWAATGFASRLLDMPDRGPLRVMLIVSSLANSGFGLSPAKAVLANTSIENAETA